MNVLDDLQAIKKLDPNRAYDSIAAFPQQLEDIWRQVTATPRRSASHTVRGVVPSLPPSGESSTARGIVIAGMGGSALGGRIIQSLFETELKIPCQIVTEYQLPAWVGKNTLVIIASYSGNTEETLNCLADAEERGAKIFGITTGGKVGERIKAGLPGMIFKPQHNPLGYPKTAIGYSLGGLLAFFEQTGLIKINFQQGLNEFKQIQKSFLSATPTEQNPAKKLAEFLQGKIGILIASEHLKGAAWAARNQINEIAHAYALFFDLPEMDHHLVEAFGNPLTAKKILGYVFLTADYHPHVKIRYPITEKIIQEHDTPTFTYNLQSKSRLAQALEIIQLGGFTAAYLSFLNHQDPGPEPWILKLKKQLAAHEQK